MTETFILSVLSIRILAVARAVYKHMEMEANVSDGRMAVNNLKLMMWI